MARKGGGKKGRAAKTLGRMRAARKATRAAKRAGKRGTRGSSLDMRNYSRDRKQLARVRAHSAARKRARANGESERDYHIDFDDFRTDNKGFDFDRFVNKSNSGRRGGGGGSGGGGGGNGNAFYEELRSWIESNADMIAEAGYDHAISMCANEGQIALIEQIGVEGFWDSIDGNVVNREALISIPSHPDIVIEIIDEAIQVMAVMMFELEQDFMMR